MLINIYKQILIMSSVGGVLYLILKLLSIFTLKYFTATWHYYSNLTIYSFFIIPYHKIISLVYPVFHLSIKTTPIIELNQTNIIAVEPAVDNAARLNIGNYAAVAFDYVTYILMIGTLIFIAVVFVKNYRLKHRIFKSCRITEEKHILRGLMKCKQKLDIKRKIPVCLTTHISTPHLWNI